VTQGVDLRAVDFLEPTPARTCVGCRTRTSKADLLRVVVDGDEFVADPQGRLAGRGAYLHPKRECFELAVRRKGLSRALRVSGHIRLERLAATFEARELSEVSVPSVISLEENKAMSNR
jgi:predicted RNA-binding protein YlxR (DUF448 family)